MSQIDGPFIAPLSGKARHLVVLLHGYGASGADLLSMGSQWADNLPDAAFVAPNAPEVCESWPPGFQWFPIRVPNGIIVKESLDRKELVMRPAKILDGFLDTQLKKWGVPESKLAVVGFSQGAMMASYVMPRRLKPCAGIVSYSGMLIDSGGLKGERIVKMPVLAVHGDADEIVPHRSLDELQTGFETAGFQVEAIMRSGLGHCIDEVGFMRGLDFLQESFGIAT